MSRQRNHLDKAIERAYYQLAAGTSINVLDIGKLYADCRKAVLEGGPAVLDSAMIAAIRKYAVQS